MLGQMSQFHGDIDRSHRRRLKHMSFSDNIGLLQYQIHYILGKSKLIGTGNHRYRNFIYS